MGLRDLISRMKTHETKREAKEQDNLFIENVSKMHLKIIAPHSRDFSHE